MNNRFDARPLSESLPYGVEISGLRPEDIADPAVQDSLRRYWVKDGLLVFKGLEGAETHLALSRVFGPLQIHPLRTDAARKEIFTVRHDPDDPYIVEVAGVPLAAWLPWHSDLFYVDRINHGGMLRPLVLPERGGETGFIDKIAAYAALPQRLKDKVQDLNVIYQFDRNPERQVFGRTHDIKVLSETKQAVESKNKSLPRVIHPMVYEQAETGRKVLNVSPWFAVGVEGMTEAESNALLHEVMLYAINPELSYWHSWQMGEMVLWDNWRMLHCAAGCPPDDQRWMERTTIAGDYGLGRVESNQRIDVGAVIDV
jgi:taurine dioxygenase